jgi:Protein of unknown function (DUF2812).
MEYKYLMNMGLAFDEDRIIKKLGQLSKDGWRLKEMTLFRYKLIKGELEELVYSLDYKEICRDEEDEYFGLFESSGWKHMCSYGPFHFFAAPPNTVPIYTDKENHIAKYKSTKDIYHKTLFYCIIVLTALALLEYFAGSVLKNTIFKHILLSVEVLSTALAVPSLMVSVAFFIRERKILNSKVK